ncbi:MAG: hypothetical protein ABI194_04645, partial [Gemmatimonadaceae bacterium]
MTHSSDRGTSTGRSTISPTAWGTVAAQRAVCGILSRRLPLVAATLAAALAAGLLSGCTGEARPASGGGTLVISTAADADHLFPPLVVTSQGRQVAEQIFEPLADIGDSLNVFGDGGFIPRLADS